MGRKGTDMATEKELERPGVQDLQGNAASDPNFDYEKQGLARKNKGGSRPWKHRRNIAVIVCLLLVNLFLRFDKNTMFGAKVHGDLSSPQNRVQHSFEVTVEKLPSTDPVFTQHLLSSSFGDSWGKPAKAHFEPYNGGKYDKIILELVTNVTGRQFDRLLHVFIDDINVWRSSTVEPWGNRTIVSEAIKDISQYRALFDRESLEITLQLDNLVTHRLTGVFNVELRAHYYQTSNDTDVSKPSLREKLLQYFTSPANLITPLVSHFSRTPLFYYPRASQGNPRWSRSLPELEESSNISRAMIEIFASGNAAEEFWYTNVLDRFTNRFRKSGHELLGHGPFRAIKIYLTNSEKEILVDSVVPTPIIFTGFIPPLWRPCVGMNAFDLESYKVDLTPFLSLIEGESWELQLEVVSSASSNFKPTVGENWIISGNVFVWNNTLDATQPSFTNSSMLPSSFDVFVNDSKPDELIQNVSAKNGVLVESTITLDGVEYQLHQTVESTFTSNQKYLENGDVEKTFVDLSKERKWVFRKADKDLFEFTDRTGWDFVGSVKTFTSEKDSSQLTYAADVARSLERHITLQEKDSVGHQVGNDNVLLSLAGSQVGQANYTLSSNGNYGSGNSVHSVCVERAWPYEDNYERTVVVADNEVVLDDYK
ncbi:KLTH0F05940p [Lachancea thermotolerans CBS 6340]|uniref:KLTH0F05940p n=1 Tax=Lachancea thermotolerans (strain ATCC 56472 / CBS 6340 / NRRL Y-8284) TaxID=559295 RepID=C5DKM6_LACTC|nr:KLTH0F05940p [Lachancea thermotolerans CBS 6340]CAR24027.1 KLTH0F05940p [Lachancea thermotolerans CBS 6340]